LVRAYIFIEMMAGHAKNLVDRLSDQQAVADIDRVTGPYDVIAILEASTLDEISNIVTSDVHSLSGVVRTTTCVCLE
jgi:DNA-binding Lrp family transcriptional regulator